MDKIKITPITTQDQIDNYVPVHRHGQDKSLIRMRFNRIKWGYRVYLFYLPNIKLGGHYFPFIVLDVPKGYRFKGKENNYIHRWKFNSLLIKTLIENDENGELFSESQDDEFDTLVNNEKLQTIEQAVEIYSKLYLERVEQYKKIYQTQEKK